MCRFVCIFHIGKRVKQQHIADGGIYNDRSTYAIPPKILANPLSPPDHRGKKEVERGVALWARIEENTE